MKFLNPYSKLSISVLFTIALSTGFLSMTYVQRAHAFSIDFSGLPGFGGDQGLNFFQGPKGDKGDTGPQGIPGEKGDTGSQGEQGLQGEKGDKGDKGDTGAQGAQGEKGEKGDKGDKGDTGAQGAPCPHQSGLIEHMRPPNGIQQEPSGDLVIPTSPTTGEDPTLVCVP